MFKKLAIAACLSLGAIGGAQASVILVGPVQDTGTGIGSQFTLLNITSPANTTNESGTVFWNGSTSVANGSDIQGGTNNQTYTFATAGISQASDLRVIFNINEPGNDRTVSLNSLVFNVYGNAGNLVWTGSLASPVTLEGTQSGVGSAGYLFRLDTTQAAALQALWNANLHFGISSSISNASGGYETFFLANAASVTPGPGPQVPEPGTLALLGLSMLGGVAVVRRKKRG